MQRAILGTVTMVGSRSLRGFLSGNISNTCAFTPCFFHSGQHYGSPVLQCALSLSNTFLRSLSRDACREYQHLRDLPLILSRNPCREYQHLRDLLLILSRMLAESTNTCWTSLSYYKGMLAESTNTCGTSLSFFFMPLCSSC